MIADGQYIVDYHALVLACLKLSGVSLVDQDLLVNYHSSIIGGLLLLQKLSFVIFDAVNAALF